MNKLFITTISYLGLLNFQLPNTAYNLTTAIGTKGISKTIQSRGSPEEIRFNGTLSSNSRNK